MMDADRIEAITALLAEAGEAHGAYEEAELGGVYDEDWARWYAAWAVDHGIAELVGRPIGSDELAGFLASTNAELERTEPKPSESWAEWTARRLAAER